MEKSILNMLLHDILDMLPFRNEVDKLAAHDSVNKAVPIDPPAPAPADIPAPVAAPLFEPAAAPAPAAGDPVAPPVQ